ncbi:Sodium/hydrogen exchanger family-domain-containing protein, partial [Endogone sp. FLAS-F59071]
MALYPERFRGTVTSSCVLAVVVGIVVGPLCANVIDPFHWTDTDIFTKELTRVTIAIQVGMRREYTKSACFSQCYGCWNLAAKLHVCPCSSPFNLQLLYIISRYMWREFRSMFIFLFPVMSYMWIVSAAAIYLLVPPLTFVSSHVESLAIAACITPTDPILANSVVKGRFAEKHVPTHVQNILSAESGANDGMGFPFLYLALYLLHDPGSPGEDVGKWFYLTWLYQILLSCVIGALVGYAARRILQLAEQRKLIDKPSFLVFAIALA